MIDPRPTIAVALGALLLCAALLVNLKSVVTDDLRLYRAVERQALARTGRFEPRAFWGRCLRDRRCWTEYLSYPWSRLSPPARALATVGLAGGALVVFGLSWRPEREAALRMREQAMRQPEIALESASAPRRFT